MTVTETLNALGAWSLQLREETPDFLVNQLGFFGHVAIADGEVDVEAVGDGLLTGARYVGVLRGKDRDTGRTLTGSGMVFWLGDEDGKGDILETEVSLTAATLSAAVTAIVGPSNAVTVGTVHSVAGTYTGKHQFQSRREALSIICDAFNVEFLVNGNGTVDVGTAAQLYNTEAPDTIIVRKGAGTDMDLVALGGEYAVDESAVDYSTRVVLLGQTVGTGETADVVFATGSADAPSVPYLNLRGNTVKQVRTISESGTTTGSVAARAQLALNRFNRTARSLKVSAEEFETEGNFVVGDNVYVYDPDTGIVNAAIQVTFRGEVLHPDVVRASGITWPVVRGMTVAFRTQAGVWLDLSPFVTWETGGNELTVGDLPKSLTKATDNAVQVRLDAARADASIPNAPTGLTLTTSSTLNAQGVTGAVIHASWTAPTLNTDGSVLTDLSHYVVEYRWTARAPLWQQANATDLTELDLIVVPGLPYEVRVTAVDLAGNASAPTATGAITSAADATAPNPPADPVVSSYLGQLRIEYAGTDSTGNPMASDTNRIDVHVSATNGFTPSLANRISSITPFAVGRAYDSAPYGAVRYVRLVAVDHSGNPSAASAQISGSTTQVADGDVASVSVGKLTAGTISADVVLAGRLATALTGARREVNAVGFQAWDASNNLTISLDGVSNLLTGKFQTDLTGNRRIEMASSGGSGTINFWAPDGKSGRISSFTATFGQPGTEAIRVGIVPESATIWQGWGSLQMEGTGVDQSQINGMSAYANFVVGGNGPETTKAFAIQYASDRGTATTNPTRISRLTVTSDGTYIYDPSSSSISRVAVETGGVYLRDINNYNRLQLSTTNTLIRDSANVTRFSATTTDYTRITAPSSQGVTLADHDGSTASDRFYFNSSQFNFRWRGFNTRTEIERLTSDNKFSPAIAMINNNNYGATLYYYDDGSGTNPRVGVDDPNHTTYLPLWAASFVVSSSGTTKDDVRDVKPGALDKVRAMRVVDFIRKASSVRKPDATPEGDMPDDQPPASPGVQRREIGLIAEEVADVAPELVVEGRTPMIDLPGWTALNTAAIQELREIVDTLRRSAP